MNEHVKKVIDFIKREWITLIFILFGIFFIVWIGFLKFTLAMIYVWIMVMYAMVKSYYVNTAIRSILKVRTSKDENKIKVREKVYEKAANKQGHKVKKFSK